MHERKWRAVNEVVNKVRYADSIQTLWYARSDVMAALAGKLGEGLATQHLADVSLQFTGLLPEARDFRLRRRPR